MSEQKLKKATHTTQATETYELEAQKRVIAITKTQYEKLTQKPFRVILSDVSEQQVKTLVGFCGNSLKTLSYNGERVAIALFNSDVLRMVTEITKVDFKALIEKHCKNFGFLAVVNSDLRDNIKRLSFDVLVSYL